MKTIAALFMLCFVSTAAFSRRTDSTYLAHLVATIDSLVVLRNLPALTTLYADDFVFSHGTGLVDSKSTWLQSVAKSHYTRRHHDSVAVGVHKNIGIVRGKMNIERQDSNGLARYILRYVRVFAHRHNRWQLISHITTFEQHLF